MKRYIVPFICILLFPLFVYADMGVPNPRESKVIVSNDNGANLYNWDKELITTIPSDTIIYISYEFTIDGELYAEVYYENEYGMIRLSDVKHFEEKVDPETYSENKSNRKYYSLEETYIYKGPSRAYSKEKKTIPKGEILEYKYYAEKYYLSTEEPAWIYVKYDGVSGWVYTYSFYEQGNYDIESTLVEYVEDGSLITMESDIPVFSDKGLTDQIGKLTLNQEYKIKYKLGRDSYSIKNESYFCPKYIYKYYIESEEISGWISSGNVNIEEKETVTSEKVAIKKKDKILLVTKNTNVYENFYDTTTVSGINIPKNTILEYDYIYVKDIKENNYKYELTLIARIEYNEKKYWITLNENEIAKRNTNNFSYKTEKTVDLYDKRTAGRKVLDTIPKNTVFKELYIYEHDQLDTWYYVEYKDQWGWISASESLMSANPIQEPEKPEIKIEDEDEKDEKGGKKMTVLETALVCLGGALIVAITSIVTIILLNKKKKEEKPSIVQVNTPSDATIEHKELVRLLDEALKKEHVDSAATIEHKELVRLLDEALKKEHVDSAATIEHKELVRLLDEALELDKHIDSDATIEHKELVKLLDRALEKEHIDSAATIEHKELVRLLDEALKKEHIDSAATIEHKELVRLLDEALKKEHVDSAATIEHKELVRLLDEALELDKHIDSDATIEHKELVRLLDEALKKEEKPKNKKNKNK